MAKATTMKNVALAMKDHDDRPDAIRAIAEFMRCYSIEATRPTMEDVSALGGVLPKGTSVYVSAVPTRRAEEAVGHALRLRQSGFEPVPHLAVRTFSSVGEVDRFLARLTSEAGVRQLLVIGGDRDPPVGALRSALDVIDSGLLQRHGIREVGVAGYPQGHPKIPGPELDRALADKIAAAEATGLRLHIVTQFCFDADAITGWIRRLRDFGFDTPVRVGLAGPTNLSTLMRYASRCGVSASVHGLARHAGLLRNLFAMSAPDAIVRALAAERDRLGDVTAHFFSFGGLARTARWASAVELGHVALEAGQGFRVEPAT
jgi:methylenetetrahydrofolate reductase (NADPH)